MNDHIHISNCPVCDAFPVQHIDAGHGLTAYRFDRAAAPEPPAPGVVPDERMRDAIEILREVTDDEGAITDDLRMDHLCSVVRRIAALATLNPPASVGVGILRGLADDLRAHRYFDWAERIDAALQAPPAPITADAREAFGAALRSVEAVTEMELHQVATGETLPGYRIARRAAETELWLLIRSHGPILAASLSGAKP